MKVLVTYASRHGATKGIAERIAQTLQRADLDVVLLPIEEAAPIAEYGAIVIGSAAYMGGWMSEATKFVRRNLDVLTHRRVWLFSSGPIGTDPVDAKGRDQLVAARPKEFEEFARSVRPRDEHVFFGAYDPDAEAVGVAEGLMARFMRLMPAARDALPAGDFRDWKAIEAWAEEIARELQPVGAAS
jgi:menaquinone-dependent protoporphyrinogen oxidase